MSRAADVAPADRPRARSAAYRLFARLFRREVTPDLEPLLREIPDLGNALPDPFDADQAGAEHHRLFALQVPPYAGVFLDAEGRIGGPPAARMRDLYGRAGLELDERSEEADHVAHLLDLLAELEGRPALAGEALDLAALPWLAWLVEALERHGDAFHVALAGLTLDLALDHRRTLKRLPTASAPVPLEDPLADETAGLRRIAEYLVTPARSGLYLARDDVRRLAAGVQLPSGFGGRAESLETLLRTAAELGGFAELIEGLERHVAMGRRACDALDGTAVPGVGGPAALRRARLARAAEVLARLREGAAAGGSSL